MPPLALLEHLLAGRARHQPGLGDVGVHHVEEILRLLVDDLRHFVQAGGDHQDVEPAELVDRGLDDLVAVFFRARPQRDHRRSCRRAPRIRPRPSSARPPCSPPAPHWRRRRPGSWPPARRRRPIAPVTMAVLPLTSNSDERIFQECCRTWMSSRIFFACHAPRRRGIARNDGTVGERSDLPPSRADDR